MINQKFTILLILIIFSSCNNENNEKVDTKKALLDFQKHSKELQRKNLILNREIDFSEKLLKIGTKESIFEAEKSLKKIDKLRHEINHWDSLWRIEHNLKYKLKS